MRRRMGGNAKPNVSGQLTKFVSSLSAFTQKNVHGGATIINNNVISNKDIDERDLFLRGLQNAVNINTLDENGDVIMDFMLGVSGFSDEDEL